MQTRTMSRDAVTGFLRAVLADHHVVAPVEAEPGFYRFEAIEDAADVVLDYVSTVMPPKKVMFPQRDVLFEFGIGGDGGKPTFKPVIDETPGVLVGVHPCDLAGIVMLDWAFEKDHKDEHYLARRRATTIIGVDCHPDEHCFCTAVGTMAPREGFDLFLTPIDKGYLVSVGTQRGADLLNTCGEPREATPEDLAAARRWQAEKKEKVEKRFETEIYNLPLTFQHSVRSSTWKEVVEPCLNCGTCNLVCPTCFCFEVEDVLQPNGKVGVRQRSWDACQLAEFARVAGGANFRGKPEMRLRHRFYRKYQYLMTQYGAPFCTGCGRCGRSCPVDINIVDTINSLIAIGRKEGTIHV